MSPDNPFLRALLSDPDDDTLRLAMADYLDEHDDAPRAEFVRVQVELARGVEDRARRDRLEIRQRDLLLAHEAEWVRPLAAVLDRKPGEWGGWVFRRGFVEYFHLPASVINRRGEQLARLTPVRELFLRPCTAHDVVSLCERSWLRSVTALYLQATQLDERAALALLACPHLNNLRVLDVVLEDVEPDTERTFNLKFGRARFRAP